MVTLADAKAYLRIDADLTQDDSLLTAVIAAAGSYLKSAVDKFETYYTDSDFAAKADLVQLALISEMYRNRDPSNDGREDYPYYIRSQITQLQNWVPVAADANDENVEGGDAP